MLAGLALDRLLPRPFDVPGTVLIRWVAGGALIVSGLTLFASAVREFSRAATPLPTNQPVRVLVTTGVYQWTRNPVYLGFFLAYGGIGVTARSPWILLLALPLAVTIRHGVVAREEAYLARRFGDAYREYETRVRRWL